MKNASNSVKKFKQYKNDKTFAQPISNAFSPPIHIDITLSRLKQHCATYNSDKQTYTDEEQAIHTLVKNQAHFTPQKHINEMLDIFYLKRKNLVQVNALLYTFKVIHFCYKIPNDILNIIALDVCNDYQRHLTYKCINTLNDHKAPIKCLTLTSDNNYFISGSSDGEIKIWNIKTGICLRTLAAHDSSIKSIQISNNNTQFFSLDIDSLIKKWDLPTGTHLDNINPPDKPANTFTLLGDDKIAIGYQNGSLEIENTNKLAINPLILDQNAKMVTSLLGTKDNFLISSREWDYTITIWNLSDINNRKHFLKLYNDCLITSATSDNTHITVSYSKNNNIQILTRSGKVINTLHFDTSLFFNTHAITPNDKYIISGLSDNQIIVSDLHTSKVVSRLYSHTQAVNAIAITSDSNYLLSGSDDCTIKIWQESLAGILKKITHWQSIVTCSLLLDIPVQKE